MYIIRIHFRGKILTRPPTLISPGSLKINDQTVAQLDTEILTISFLKSVAGPQEFPWDTKCVVLWSPASNYSKQMLCFVPDIVFNNKKKSSFVTLECCLNVKWAHFQLNHSENIVHEMTMSTTLFSTITLSSIFIVSFQI